MPNYHVVGLGLYAAYKITQPAVSAVWLPGALERS